MGYCDYATGYCSRSTDAPGCKDNASDACQKMREQNQLKRQLLKDKMEGITDEDFE